MVTNLAGKQGKGTWMAETPAPARTAAAGGLEGEPRQCRSRARIPGITSPSTPPTTTLELFGTGRRRAALPGTPHFATPSSVFGGRRAKAPGAVLDVRLRHELEDERNVGRSSPSGYGAFRGATGEGRQGPPSSAQRAVHRSRQGHRRQRRHGRTGAEPRRPANPATGAKPAGGGAEDQAVAGRDDRSEGGPRDLRRDRAPRGGDRRSAGCARGQGHGLLPSLVRQEDPPGVSRDAARLHSHAGHEAPRCARSQRHLHAARHGVGG